MFPKEATAVWANMYMANEIERQYSSRGLHGISLHPSGIKSNLQVHANKEGMLEIWELPEVKATEKTPAQGAATSVYGALSRDWEGKGGISYPIVLSWVHSGVSTRWMSVMMDTHPMRMMRHLNADLGRTR